MPNWSQRAASRAFDVQGFCFDSGERADLRLHYQTLGEITPDADNVVLMLHGTVGSGKQFLQPSTADALFGNGQPLDVVKYCVVLPDAIGHGLSSKPSDGLGARFPRYGYGDIVRAQHLLVTEHLRLTRLPPGDWDEHGRHAHLDVGSAIPRDDGCPAADRQPA